MESMEEQLDLLDPESSEFSNTAEVRIAQAVVAHMQKHKHVLWQDSETHAEEHTFIKELIHANHIKLLAEQKKQERRERVIERVTGSVVVSAVLAGTALVGSGVIDWLKGHLK